MPRTLITITAKHSFVRSQMVRLIQKDDGEGYYVSCWSLPAYFWLTGRREQWEDFDGPNWKREIATAEADQLLQALSYQMITIVPQLPEEEMRDGTYYEFTFENGLHRFHLEWPNEIPNNWRSVWTVVERLLEIAGSSA